MRWIGAVVVALCLVAGGAVRPARASELDPSDAQLSAAKALRAELAPRRPTDTAPDRRTPAPPVAIAPAATTIAPPRLALRTTARVTASSLTATVCSTRSSRGPPR